MNKVIKKLILHDGEIIIPKEIIEIENCKLIGSAKLIFEDRHSVIKNKIKRGKPIYFKNLDLTENVIVEKNKQEDK